MKAEGDALLGRAIAVRAGMQGDFETHLRLAHLEGAPLLGSSEGRKFWDSPEAKAFVGKLLEIPEVHERFGDGPPFVLRELEGRVAALLGQWLVRGQRADDISQLVAELTSKRREGFAAWLVQDLMLDERVEVFPWLMVHPADAPTLLRLAENRPNGVAGLPRSASAVLAAAAAANEGDLGPSDGPFVGMGAIASANLMAMTLRTAVWLVTGSLAPVVVRLAGEYARFPAVRIADQNESYLARELHSETGRLRVADVSAVQWIVRLLTARPWMTDPSTATSVAVRTALRLAEIARGSVDGLAVNLTCYAGLDALLSGRREPDSRTPPRLRVLLSPGADEGKTLARRVERMYSLRGDFVHGREPPDEDIRVALELEQVEDELLRRPESLHVALGQSSLGFLRAAICATLPRIYELQDAETFPGTWRERRNVEGLRSLLEAAAKNEAEAVRTLSAELPDWAWSPLRAAESR